MITQQELNDLLEEYTLLSQALKIDVAQEELSKLQVILDGEDLWEEPDKAAVTSKRAGELQKEIEVYELFQQHIEDLKAAFELKDESEITSLLSTTKSEFTDLKKRLYLSGKFDRSGAIVSLHTGAGGVDAMDFTAMLLHMYQAFCKKMEWSFKIISLSEGEEAGIKSAMIEVQGTNAYGLLKEEAGVHRLVRISPFNSGKTRETSFALVEVIPDNLHEEVNDTDIQEDDLKWDYFMSSGKGGQSVNTTYSAVRVTHLPTGISVSCQNERSQQQNKLQALKYLKNKLAVLEAEKIDDLKKEIRGEFHSIEWGNHIRSYVLHPYKMVKDHRNSWQSNQPEDILENGNLSPLIWSLKMEAPAEK
jgi:peptide chain release factor 2